jgi:hypothetical protein
MYVLQDSDSNTMTGGLCNRTIAEYILSGNISKLKNFLESRHVNIEDADEVLHFAVQTVVEVSRPDFRTATPR